MKLLQGTLQPCRDRPEVAFAPIATVPDPPDWLINADAVAAWRDYGAILVATGVLTEGDVRSLAHVCNLEAAAIRLYRTGQVPSPPESSQLRMGWGEFGLTPATRARARPAAAQRTANAFSGVKGTG